MTALLPFSSFELISSCTLSSLGLQLAEYQHCSTGARHYHLASDNDENVFLVALRTLPMDSTGVAHILEHTALCGSERFPVRDPFFMMIRRSLNTFMNAMTSSDWTAYPFATQNRKDFDNLLRVYLDAVFFSRLDALDFSQEGHRIEFTEPGNPASPLVYKGVVFNEMKGAMSSPVSQVYETLNRYLFPTTTYHYNSGGDPEHITDLTHEQLLAFYRRHYHPSNAVFMTFGNIPVAEHQQKFEELVLSHFQRSDDLPRARDEKRYYAPLRVEDYYSLDANEGTERRTHVVMSWLLGHSGNLQEKLQAHLLTGVLLDNSASPLRRVLETSELGDAPSPLCGLEDSSREMAFFCGLEGSEGEHADAIEQLVLDTLNKVAQEGVPVEQVEAVLHQLELSQREIGGDGYPYGLQLIFTSLSSALHGGDPAELLDIDTTLASLREQIKNPDFVPGLVRRLLLDNGHRVRLVMRPDTALSERRQQAEAAQLAHIAEQLSDSERQHLQQQAEALAARQAEVDDEAILPRLSLADVPEALVIAEGERLSAAAQDVHFYAQGTNGIVYQQIVLDLPDLDAEEQCLLPIYAAVVTETGAGDQDYLALQQRQAAVSGGIQASWAIRGSLQDAQRYAAHMVFSGKALANRYPAFDTLMRDIFSRVRFDELPRLRELVSQRRHRIEQRITGSGHGYAMQYACSRFGAVAHFNEQLGGLTGVRSLKALDDSLDDSAALQHMASVLQRIHQKMLAANRRFLLIAEEGVRGDMLAAFAQGWQQPAPAGAGTLALPAVHEQTRTAWLCNSQVNFCARAYPTVSVDHEDAAALTVLGQFLRNGYLHRAVREQGGAYGGGAGQDSGIAAFRFFSYRDPRLEETLNDFDRSLEWLQSTAHDGLRLEEAILGLIGDMDKPSSPAGEARSAFHNQLHGRTPEQRQRFRQRLLAVSIADLQRVAAQYLRPERASTAVVTHAGMRERCEQLGLQIEVL